MQKAKDSDLRTLNKRHAFGIKSDVYGCIHWLDESTVAYPVGRNVVMHNIQSNAQKFFLTSEKTDGITAIALSPNKKYIAIAESGEHPQIQIVDTNTRKRRRVLNVTDLGSDRFVCMQFSADGRHLATQGGAPQWNLLHWNWERSKPLAQTQVQRDTALPQVRDLNYNLVTQISINPKDPLHIAVSGNALFRFYRYVDGILKPQPGGVGKAHTQNFTAHAWVTDDRIIVATDNADLLLLEDGELKCPLSQAPSDNHAITVIQPTSKGFVCAGEMGLLHIFEATEDSKEHYKKVRTVTIDSRRDADDGAKKSTIRALALTHGEDMLAMATSSLQIYGMSFNVEWSKHETPIFMPITQQFHAGPIVGLDACVRKPLVATSSTDKSVRIWNIQEHTVEVIKYFPSEPGAVALHPSGLHILVCFPDRVRFMNLYGDNIAEFKSFITRAVAEVKFSVGGQYFCFVHGNIIQIYNTYTCELGPVGQLRGHSQKVRSVQWCANTQYPTDTRLVSCSMDGTVIDWTTKEFRKDGDHIAKGYQYMSVVSDDKNVWVVGAPASSQGDTKWKCKLRELEVSNMHGDSAANDYEFSDLFMTTLALAPQHRLLFGGCTDGSIKLMPFPLQSGVHETPILTHAGAVTKMVVSFDETILFSVGNDGSFYIFDIKEDGRTAKRETTYAEEILISKVDLDEKNNTATALRQTVEDLKLDMEYQEKRRGIQHDERVKELTDNFKEDAEKQAMQFAAVWNAKVEQEKAFAEIKRDNADQHRRSCDDLEKEKEAQLRALEELCSQRSKELQRQKDEFEEFLAAREKEITQQRGDAMERHAAALRSETDALEKLRHHITRNNQTHRETRSQLEMDTDSEIENIKKKYDEALLSERNGYLQMKGETAILKKNYALLSKEKEVRQAEVRALDASKLKLNAQIKDLNTRISQLHADIDDRDMTIGEKEKKIYELKKRNQELEKHKFVLDHRIRQLKSQIEPRQIEIARENEKIKAKDAELEQYHKNNLALRINIEDLKTNIGEQQSQIKSLLNRLKDFETYKSRVKTDIGALAQLVQDPVSLVEGIAEVFHTHVTKRGGKRCAALEAELQQEFATHGEFLSKTVESLKRKVAQDQEAHKTEIGDVIVENLQLIKEIHELRKEIRTQRNAGTTAAAAEAAAAASLAGASSGGNTAREQTAKEVEQNRHEIQRLRGKIDELERSLAVRAARSASRDVPSIPVAPPHSR